MSDSINRKDLLVLTADKNAEYGIRGVLSRHQAIGIRSVEAVFHRHPEKDSGVLCHSRDFLRPFATDYAHVLVIMDKEGCGQDRLGRTELENQLEDDLRASGWESRGAAIVLDPELEIWVWSESPHVDDVLGWRGRQPDLRSWLLSEGFVQNKNEKPARPKEALQAALREARKPRSSAIYEQLAQKVSLLRCQDGAFRKLAEVLRNWFPAP
jgi:hypothetical protein